MTRLLLVGGGHASLPLLTHAAGRLVEHGVGVTLLNDSPRLYYSGMVPEYLGGVYTREQTTIDLAGWCERVGATFVLGRAARLDVRSREVETAHGETLGFDVAAFDVGAVNPGEADGVIRTRPMHRIEALEAFVSAALAADGGPQRLVVVGGGAAGVEVVLNVTARVQAHRPEALQVVLLEPSDRLLPGFPSRMSRRALQTLSERGAEIRLGLRAERAEADTVHLPGGERLPADAVLWATGGVGQPLFREAGLRVDERGFVRVDRTLQVLEHPHLFVAGDGASVDGYAHLERIGVHAVRQGPVLCHNVRAAVEAVVDGRRPDAVPMRRFRPYPVAPLILSTGRPAGWMRSGRLALSGGPILRLKHVVDRRWMSRYVPDGTYTRRLDADAALAR